MRSKLACCALVLALAGSVGCNSGDVIRPRRNSDAAAGGGGESGSGGRAGAGGGGRGGAGGSGGESGGSGGATAGSGGAPDAGPGADATTGPTITTDPMPIISQGVPSFASGSDPGSPPGQANDDMPGTSWSPNALPGWIAYDLSGAPMEQRQKVLVAWYGPRTIDYLNPMPRGKELPADYTIEINTAPGGGAAPTAGWTVVATITGNTRSSVQHLVDLNGASWIRMNISKSADRVPSIDLDVHGAAAGASDSWLFMGDSITAGGLARTFSDLPQLVHAAKPDYYPAVIDAAIGGTNTATALDAIDATLAGFPGRFVTLNYGTNDHPIEYVMEDLVKKVIAAGKVPVVPHMPWSNARLDEGPMINKMIDALYDKYPEIVRGPDLWAAFLNRNDLIPPGDVHPNDLGQKELRKQWAASMQKLYR
jgi:hypothetical protein